ncbi:DIP1984 family protein [Nocardiopsis ansamitocini]|uniref:DIP1984 family protein n=1 Tax=Nocardiopsis ansamitocini TaxID=1670832 RepID=A0A9W6P3P5_9ACTN|nr:DIP1984 family protein [Nocardiopsis ansamitocini]GLU46543.1 hypothetical protein Nans01_08940 [Nocardiopsis ansamitocini]
MRLAEALSRRAHLATHMAEVSKRALANAHYQEGTEPAEDPNELLAEHTALAQEFETLVRRINATNLATRFSDGSTLTDALARRDALRLRHRLRVELADAGTARSARYGRSEIRTISAIDVRQLRADADEHARELRELDNRVQEANWATQLVD